MNTIENPKEFHISKKTTIHRKPSFRVLVGKRHVLVFIIQKTLGVSMAIPTICIAIDFLFKIKTDVSELYHNIAVLLWIIGNT